MTNFTVLTQPASGTLSGSAPNLTYRPATNFVGGVNFTFSVNDGALTSGVATVTITLTNINDAPLAVNDVAGTTRNKTVSIAVLANDSDPDNDPLTITNIVT